MGHKTFLKYIELRSAYNGEGPAWIARVRMSRSGRTVYFNGRALKQGLAGGGNVIDLESRESYWVSGVKRDGTDRHSTGSGKVFVEASAVDEYLKVVARQDLTRRGSKLLTTYATPIHRFS